MFKRIVLAASTVLVVAGCATGTPTATTSLAPPVDAATPGYTDSVVAAAAQIAWDANTPATIEVICNGWNMGAEAMMRDSYVEGAGGDLGAVQLWEATVPILDRECK